MWNKMERATFSTALGAVDKGADDRTVSTLYIHGQSPGDVSMNAKSWASSVLTILACVLSITLVMRPTVVSGASMLPTLHDKDLLITSPLATKLAQPRRGDIVTICLSASPLCGFIFSRDTQYVKRIVALPGDLVRHGACAMVVTTPAGEE